MQSAMRRRYDAVIWDMDGVLLDSEPLSAQAVEKTCSDHGMSYTPESNGRFFGMSDRDVFLRLTKEFGCRVPVEQLVDQAARAYLQIVQERPLGLRPGVKEALDQFASFGLVQAVASSSNPLRIKKNLEMLNIKSYMKVTVSGLEMSRGKPHPEIYLKAAELIGVAPSRCLAIEDAEAGVESATSAGMTCVAFPCPATAHQPHTGAFVRVENLATVDWAAFIFRAS